MASFLSHLLIQPFHSNSVSQFQGVFNLTIFISANYGADSTRIHFLGLRGEFARVHREITIKVAGLSSLNPTANTRLISHDRNHRQPKGPQNKGGRHQVRPRAWNVNGTHTYTIKGVFMLSRCMGNMYESRYVQYGRGVCLSGAKASSTPNPSAAPQPRLA